MGAKLYRYFYGTFTNRNEGGREQVYAVANADEIQASSMNIRELQARNQSEAFDAAMQIHRDSYRTTWVT